MTPTLIPRAALGLVLLLWSVPGWASFPAVATESGGGQTNAVTTHPITLPTGIASGDLLLACFAMDAAITGLSGWPSGWEIVYEQSNGAGIGIACRYKIATGSETTFDLTTSTAERSGFTVYRITGWHGTTPPESGTAVNATTSTPDPPSLSPSWGVAETLWFVVVGIDMSDSQGTITAYPTNYTNGRQDGYLVLGGSTVGSARRELNATSDDHGTFTVTGSRATITNMIAIRPAVGGGNKAGGLVNTPRLKGLINGGLIP